MNPMKKVIQPHSIRVSKVPNSRDANQQPGDIWGGRIDGGTDCGGCTARESLEKLIGVGGDRRMLRIRAVSSTKALD
ncbi:hypothetical protein Vadar_003313 [Vaccinium darrowii]|uniref:Uncharacterized protein n=1 Tax=Vaccinium darrowii TaxID=229202 RepID=A0ACB7Z3A2_9ERIC|nr:hypothetical protein Vadar_003313 [Vaccinium darrowii]